MSKDLFGNDTSQRGVITLLKRIIGDAWDELSGYELNTQDKRKKPSIISFIELSKSCENNTYTAFMAFKVRSNNTITGIKHVFTKKRKERIDIICNFTTQDLLLECPSTINLIEDIITL